LWGWWLGRTGIGVGCRREGACGGERRSMLACFGDFLARMAGWVDGKTRGVRRRQLLEACGLQRRWRAAVEHAEASARRASAWEEEKGNFSS
jgi:hypothetical protein